MQGSISCDTKNCDATLVASQRVGDISRNAGAGLFASASTPSGVIAAGAFVDYSINNHSISLQHTSSPGVGSTLTAAGTINLHNGETHRVDANLFHSTTNLNSGFKFNKMGAGLHYNHANGHSAAITTSQVPQIGGTTVGLSGTANLWKSSDQMTRFDLNAGSYSTFGGLFDGQDNTSIALAISHRF